MVDGRAQPAPALTVAVQIAGGMQAPRLAVGIDVGNRLTAHAGIGVDRRCRPIGHRLGLGHRIIGIGAVGDGFLGLNATA